VEQQHILIRLSSIRHVEDEHSGSGITGASRSMLQKRHMRKDDAADLFNQLAQRWGVDTQLAGEIVSAAQTTYPNCWSG
jgi:hypothetical protein